MLYQVKKLRSWQANLLAAGLGALAATSLPPIHLVPVLWISIPGLLSLLGERGQIRLAMKRGFWFGFGYYAVGLYWITEAILYEADRFWWLIPFAVPALAAIMALFTAVTCGVAALASPGWPRVFALAGAFVLTDLARQFIATGFPWNPLGSAWVLPGHLGDIFLQPAAWFGEQGLTLATVLVAGCTWIGWRSAVVSVTALALWAGIGMWRLEQPLPASPGVKVALIQGNIPEGQKMDRRLAADIFTRYLSLSAEARDKIGDNPGVIVWPETASPYLLQTDQAARLAIASAAGHTVLAGSVRWGRDNRPRNSLLVITPQGNVAGIYDKWHLVPFGEYVPSWLPLPIQVIPGQGFEPGPGPRTLILPNLPSVGPLICYESIFGGQIVSPTVRPAWLVNITNDAWFGRSIGPHQHAAQARVRAVEEGLPLMRAANTGITEGFDARGHQLGRLPMDHQGILVLNLPGPLPPTLFAKFGLVIPAICGSAALLVSFLLMLASDSTIRRKFFKNLPGIDN